jgi:Flp pilus assembly protein CpaB
MNDRTIIMKYGIVALIGMAVGFYLKPTPVEVKTTTAQTVSENKKHEQVVITKKKLPDGTVETVTTKDIQSQTNTDKKQTSIDSKPINYNKAVTSVHLLASVDISSLSVPHYGLMVTHEVAGPLAIGVFGFTNNTFGVSLGVNF